MIKMRLMGPGYDLAKFMEEFTDDKVHPEFTNTRHGGLHPVHSDAEIYRVYCKFDIIKIIKCFSCGKTEKFNPNYVNFGDQQTDWNNFTLKFPYWQCLVSCGGKRISFCYKCFDVEKVPEYFEKLKELK